MTLIDILKAELIDKTISFNTLYGDPYKGQVSDIKIKKIVIGSLTAEVILIAFTDGEVAEFNELLVDTFTIL